MQENRSFTNTSRFVTFLLLLFPATARLQPYLGTKTPYTINEKNKATPAPAGYHPVFINYTGRHGARFLTKPGSDIEVLALLSYAEKNNQLTPVGKRLKAVTEKFLEIEKDNYENITLLGAAEQQAIGKRVFTLYPEAFKGNGIEMLMTHKVRTQQSGTAFRKGLTSYTGPVTEKIIPDQEDNSLRFYDISPAYRDYKKSAGLVKRIDSLTKDPRNRRTAENICTRIFLPAFVQTLLNDGVIINEDAKKTKTDALTFAGNLYDLYSASFSTPLEMKNKGYSPTDMDFGIAFESSDLAWLSFVNGASDFYEKGPGADTAGIQVTIAAPLLVDYINTTQDIISHKKTTDGIFRFTHAEAISPFATLLGIPEASTPSASVFNYAGNWQAQSIIPLSANICWIVYSNGKDYLVKVTLNEREVRLPVSTQRFPFYKWDDIHRYYLGKLHSLHTDITADMHEYLLNVK